MEPKPGTNKTAIVAIVVVALLALTGALGVYAAENGASTYPTIVDKLAKAFNLDPAKVMDVFKENKQEQRAKAEEQRQKRFEQMLDRAVKNGELTQAQKDSILAKEAEVKKKLEEINDQKLTLEERNQALAQVQKDLKAWADSNGIEPRWLTFGVKGRGMGGPGMGGPGMGGRGMGGRGMGGRGMGGKGWGPMGSPEQVEPAEPGINFNEAPNGPPIVDGQDI